MSFGDLYTVPAGTPQDPNLPPINLPQVAAEPRRPRTSLTVTPDPRPRDPFADVPEWQPEAPKTAKGVPKGDPFANIPEWEPSKPPGEKEGGRDIGPGEAAGMGAREGITFGSFPAIHGAIAAGQSEEERKASEGGYAKGEYPSAISEAGSLLSGLLQLGLSKEKATKIYNEEREAARKEQESAQQQNPVAYGAGQLGGAVATPIPGVGAAKAVATGAKALKEGLGFGRAIKAGTTGGALYGGGTALSKGEEPLDIAKDVGVGGLVGGTVGAGLHGGVQALKGLGRYGRDLIQGMYNPTAVGERRMGRALQTGQRTGTMGLDPNNPADVAAYAKAQAEGLPIHNIDIGGKATGDLGRAVSNASPEARQIIAGPLAEREAERTQRFVDRVYQLMGGTLDRGADRLALENDARIYNGPRYRMAYAKGDFPIGTDPEMQRLMGSNYIQAAMKKAVTEGQDRAIREKAGAFNPGVSVTPDGRLVFARGPSGVPTYPNIQYWDYVQRELRDMAKDNPGKSGLIEGLRKDLNKQLDKLVPEFGEARTGAARFFGAQDAIEAGENFALKKGEFKDIRDAKRAIAQFSPPERELFARSVMDTITQRLRDKPDWGTIKKLFTSEKAMETIEAAIGKPRARELEVSLRAETAARKTEEAVSGNSTTGRQIMDTIAQFANTPGGHGAIGVGGLATYEMLKEGKLDPKALVAAAVLLSGAKAGLKHVDTQVINATAEALMSNDPAVARRAVRAVSRSPALFDALRKGTEAGSRLTAHDIGLGGLIGAGSILYNEVMKHEDHGDHHGDDQSIIDQGGGHGAP